LSAKREKPKFVIIGFILNGEVITNNLLNLKVHLNCESYPYDNLNFDFSKNQYAHPYKMYTRFQSSFYNRKSQPFLTDDDDLMTDEFKLKAPIIVVYLSYQNESVKTGPIDLRISLELKAPGHENTQA